MQSPELLAEDLIAAYLRAEEKSPVRHELIGGVIYAMAGGTPNHAAIGANVTVAAGKRLQGCPCRPVSSDQRIRFENSTNFTYPDFAIKCPPYRFDSQDPNALLNPHAIFEVLSPSTADFDRAGKFDLYKTIADLSDYVLVSSDRVRIEHFRRLGSEEWVLRTYVWRRDVLKMENFELELPLAEIYEGLDVPEGMIFVETTDTA